jgi:phosphoribosylaminoimidazole carboxylase PurE protein
LTEDKVVLIMGSGSDEAFSTDIVTALKGYDVKYEVRVASAHKTPNKLLQILAEYESSGDRIVYITVAGRSNALSGFVDANAVHPVIACPPYSPTYSGADLYSTLRMPSGVCPLVVLEPASAALAATKILALGNPRFEEGIRLQQKQYRSRVEDADERLSASRGGEWRRV